MNVVSLNTPAVAPTQADRDLIAVGDVFGFVVNGTEQYRMRLNDNFDVHPEGTIRVAKLNSPQVGNTLFVKNGTPFTQRPGFINYGQDVTLDLGGAPTPFEVDEDDVCEGCW